MKQKFKRLMAGLLAVLTVITSLFANGTTVSAASPSANISFWYASIRDTGEVGELKAGYNHGKILYAMIDGHSAYCMNFGLAAKGGQLMNSYENPRTSLTDTQAMYLRYCLYYGFSSISTSAPSNDQRDQFIATQAMVWIIEKGIFGTSSADSAASKLCATAPNPGSSYAYYTALRDNMIKGINATIPSFAASRVSHAQTYELKWNEANQRFETTLNDTNGVLSEFDLFLSGYGVSRNGNNLTIYSSEVNTNATTGTFTSNSGKVQVNGNCVFWLTGSTSDQEFVSEVPSGDPLPAYIKVKTENIGYGELYKKDEVSGVMLSGAVYGIYSDSSCTNLVQKITTDKNGYAKSGALVTGTYYMKEITAPNKYVISTKVYTLLVQAGKTTTVNATDKEQLGAITIYKEGEILTGWNGSNFTYETRKLPGATFKVIAGADIYKADGVKVYNKGDLVAENLVTGSDGKVLLSNLHLGTYVVIETASIDGYTINTMPQTVNIEHKDQNAEVQYEETSIYNSRQKAVVSVTKKDADTENPLDGGKYTLYAGNDIKNYDGSIIVTKGTALQTTITGESGNAMFMVDLPIANSYYISETQAPYGYIRNAEDVYSFNFNYLSETRESASFSHTFVNDHTTAKIHLCKVDKETGKPVPQGDATLTGAIYGVYAREDIVHPDGATGVLFQADDLVATITTDENAEAEIKNLYLGTYYLKEIQAPEGYLLDETEHDVVCDYEGDLVLEVARSTKSEEQVYKQPFQLIKVSDNGDDTEAPTLAGAGFTAYLKSSLCIQEDGSYDFDNAQAVVIGNNGETTLLTDSKGHLVTQPIPYGSYVVVETIVPHNLKAVKPFEVVITENHPTEPQIWRVFIDREFTAKLRIVKKDSKTGQTVLIPNAEFKIFNMDTKEYVIQYTTYPTKVKHTSFFTDDNGNLVLPETLTLGNYRIEEVAAPDGYVVNDSYITFAVDTNTAYEIDPDTDEAIITANYVDEPAVGELTVEKNGEILDSYKGGLFADSEEKKFVYRDGNLAGAEFEIYAAEDIYTNDYQKNGNGERTKYYSSGELVATIVTDKNGKAVISDLPLGTYKVVETKAPYGFVLNREAQIVTFAYVDDKIPVIKESMVFENERQKVELSIMKEDGETESGIAGAVFGLYADEDIINADGKIIVKAGTLLEKAISNENGVVEFKKEYPFGNYHVEELEAPAGYVSTEEIVEFDAAYAGGDIEIVKLEKIFKNYPIKLEISKTDITGENELKGATLSIIDKDGNVMEMWESDGEVHIISSIPTGEYTLREEIAPYGYKIANEVKFTVENTKEIQKVSMKDELVRGKIIIVKTDEDTGKGISGVEFEIRDKDGNLIDTLVTDKDGHAESKDLDIAVFKDGNFVEDIKYYVVETKAAEGYILDSTPHEVVLQYDDETPEIVEYTLELTNKPTEPKLPQTGDNINPWLYAGIGLVVVMLGVLTAKGKKRF